MALAPVIGSFGDGSHSQGETGLSILGAGFGAFPGSAQIYANANRTGASDTLTVTAWGDMTLSGVSIDSSTNNSPGTVYLFVQREDLAWSEPFSFTLTAGASGTLTPVTESDSAVALSGGRGQDITPATEVDFAIVVGGPGSQPILEATETDSAVALTASKAKAITAATEADSAVALTGGRRQTLTVNTEADSAVVLLPLKAKSIVAAAEADTVVRLIGAAIQQGIVAATEVDVAAELTGFVGKVIQRAPAVGGGTVRRPPKRPSKVVSAEPGISTRSGGARVVGFPAAHVPPFEIPKPPPLLPLAERLAELTAALNTKLEAGEKVDRQRFIADIATMVGVEPKEEEAGPAPPVVNVNVDIAPVVTELQEMRKVQRHLMALFLLLLVD